MKRLIGVAMLLALTACNTNSQAQRTVGGAAIGAGTGALIGAAANGGRGAAVGALAGGAAGALIGRATTPNNCIYRDRNGRTFTARCP
jgi:uncharacterized protein YcfJ